MSRKRAIVAGLLALIYPGLGHVYLRAWLRAAAWFALALATAAVVVPESTIRAVEAGGFDALLSASRSLPDDALLSIAVVRVLNVFDAALLAFRQSSARSGDTAPSCPQCGKSLDDDLAFCPWCSAELGDPAEGQAVE